MKPYIHAKISAKRWGGKPEDYLDIHNFIDQTKMAMPDIRHRAILHSAFGCYLVEQMFGVVRTNSDDREYSPRDAAEEHIIEDLGFIPTVERWLTGLPIQGWMSGTMKHSMAHKSDKFKGRTKSGNKEIRRAGEEDQLEESGTRPADARVSEEDEKRVL